MSLKEKVSDNRLKLIQLSRNHQSIDYLFEENDLGLIKITGIKDKSGKQIISFSKDNENLKKNKMFSFSFKYYTNLKINELDEEIQFLYNHSKVKSIEAVILYMLYVPDKNNQTLYSFSKDVNRQTETIVNDLNYGFYLEKDETVSIWVLGGLYLKKHGTFVLNVDYMNINSKFNNIYKLNKKFLKKIEPDLIIQQEFEDEDFDKTILKKIPVKNEKKAKVEDNMMTNTLLDEIMSDLKKNSELNNVETFIIRMNFLKKNQKQRLFEYLTSNDNEVTKFINKNSKSLINKDIERNKINSQKKLITTILEEKEKNKKEPTFFEKIFSKKSETNQNNYLKNELELLEKKEYNYEENVKLILQWENFSKIIPESSYKSDLVDLLNECSYKIIMLLKSNLNIFTTHLAETLIKNVGNLYDSLEKENLINYTDQVDDEFNKILLNKFKEMKILIEKFDDFISFIFEEEKIELSEKDIKEKMNKIKNNVDRIDLF